MQQFDVIVIGGGHAGVEAASAAARLGVQTCMVTLRKEGIGQMSCNPAIGGLGKGHLVKEVDALGGLMAQAIDSTGIQFRTLNSSKGPAVRASRAQADRELYKAEVQRLIASQPNLSVIEAEVASIKVSSSGKFEGVFLCGGSFLQGRAIVITTGTFLRGLMHTGENQEAGGRQGDTASNSLSDSLKSLGFSLLRLKTGTPARIRKSSIDFSKLLEQPGEDPPKPFSMMTESIKQKQISCWITNTNERVHDIIRANRERSPIFNGQIQSGGPRYCPSIEDKVFRFADKTSHNIFLEPEGYNSDIVYPNGISTSLPLEVQKEFIQHIGGLEHAEILQAGYAVEYDACNPTALKPTLESKDIKGIYFAGQINGTSGYEEAAAQGLIAGANAALQIQDSEPLILSRGEAYTGVMIDDLITNGVDEPYRMFTSRAEYRLILREDNTSTRLCPIGIEKGLLGERQKHRFLEQQKEYQQSEAWANKTRLKPDQNVNSWLSSQKSAELKDAILIADLARRPEIKLETLASYCGFHASAETLTKLEVELKFSGYLRRQEEEISRLRTLEALSIPDNCSFEKIEGLRTEAREKFKRYRPHSIGQAMRIPGITPTAVSLLALHIKRSQSLAGS